ncbi:MAG TPA: glycosyltransferase family 39 protein [Solirubrobacteraceae bacterium]|jgi:hypothetical protein
MRSPRPWPAYAALAVILGAGLALRLYHLGHGLPVVYHADEAQHFTTRAVRMLGGDLNPHYFDNPSAFTYLIYVALRALHDWPAGRYLAHPTPAFETGRAIATVLCLLGVAGVFAVGRRLWDDAAGVAGAAVLAFAFLTVAYSRLAVTDAGALLPAVAAVYAAVRAHEDGRLRWFALGGAAVGLAVGFKYTAGLAGVPLVLAAALRVRGEPRVLAGLALSAVLAALVFVATTPYFALDLGAALDDLRTQSRAASHAKLGQDDGSGVLFYLRSLTWGLGWLAALAAAGGLVLEARERPARAALLAVFPLLLFVYLSTAGRHFGRWLLPAYPVLALLAGCALARLAARLPARRPAVRAAALGALILVTVAQPLWASVRTGRLLGRADTRVLARAYLARTLPAGARVVIEPAVPRRFFGGRYVAGFQAPPPDAVAGGRPRRFIVSLAPSRIDDYRRAGYCTVIGISHIEQRARRSGRRRVLAYYARLARESRVVFRASPFRRGAKPPPFDFDFSTHLYYPRAYVRPGPVVTVRRLDRCLQRVGGPAARVGPDGPSR